MAAAKTQQFVEGMDEPAFFADLKTRWAVLMGLLIVGEMAARIMDERSDVVAESQIIPWQSIRGMRNRIAHAYWELDMQMVWRTLQDALPDLIARLAALERMTTETVGFSSSADRSFPA